MRRLLQWFGVALVLGCFGFGLGVGLSSMNESRGADRPALSSDSLSARLAAMTPRAEAAPPPAPVPAPAPQPVSARRTIVVDIAQRLSPAVVSIGAQKTTYVREADPMGFDAYFPLYKLARRNFPYLGSGFILDQDGHVLTNYHVVEDSSTITVTLPDRRAFTAHLLDADRYVDIALLQLDDLNGATLPTVKLGDSDHLMIGETALAIGNPFGPLIADPRPSVTVGVISAVDRSFKPTPEARLYRNMIQTDAAINPGNSGGPLVNLDGEVIGINTFIFSNSGESASVGFSIPINRAAKIAQEIINYGRVRSIWLDMELLDPNPSVKQWLGLTVDHGALVKAVEIGGPAEQAGLEPGDVIVAADGNPIADSEELLAHIMSRNVGDKITLEALRQTESFKTEYHVSEAKPSPRRPAPSPIP